MCWFAQGTPCFAPLQSPDRRREAPRRRRSGTASIQGNAEIKLRSVHTLHNHAHLQLTLPFDTSKASDCSPPRPDRSEVFSNLPCGLERVRKLTSRQRPTSFWH